MTFFFFTGLKLPEIPAAALERTGACIAPISMIVIGILIGSSDLKFVFSRRRSRLICMIRLIIMPLLTILILWLTRIPYLMAGGPEILFVSFLAAAAPAAVNVTQLADIYDNDAPLAGSINIMSVILCIVTMPLMTVVYQWVFL